MTLIELYRMALDDIRVRSEAVMGDDTELGLILIPYDTEDLEPYLILDQSVIGLGGRAKLLEVLTKAVAAVKGTDSPDMTLDENGKVKRLQ